MTPRRRTSSTPGPGRGRAGRRPTRSAPATRRTSRVAATAEQPPPTSKAKLTGRAAILLLVLAVLAVSYASSMRAWIQQRSDVNALDNEIADREAALAELAQAKRRWHDPAFIETQARLRFGFVMPGETGYRVIGDDGEILSDGANELADPDTVLPADDPEWWETTWGSVVEAGKTPEEIEAENEPPNDPVDVIRKDTRKDRDKPADEKQDR